MAGLALIRPFQFEIEEKNGRRTTKEIYLNHLTNIEKVTINVITVKNNDIGK